MNKGRNIAILLGCMLCISILTFLVKINSGNNSGVVDNVRYVKGETKDGITDYTFYFVNRSELKAMLEYKGDNVWLITFEDYEYDYTVKGADKKNASVTAKPRYNIRETGPFDIISERVFLYMIYGKPPVLTVYQAITIFALVVSGGAVFIKAEELWYIVGRRKTDEIAKWEDLKVYKRAGLGIVCLAVLLLIIFIIF